MFPALNLHYPPFLLIGSSDGVAMIEAVVFWRGFTQIKGPGAPGITGSRRGQGTRLWFQDGNAKAACWMKNKKWRLDMIGSDISWHFHRLKFDIVWLLESIRQWVLDQMSTFGCLILKFFLFSGYLECRRKQLELRSLSRWTRWPGMGHQSQIQ